MIEFASCRVASAWASYSDNTPKEFDASMTTMVVEIPQSYTASDISMEASCNVTVQLPFSGHGRKRSEGTILMRRRQVGNTFRGVCTFTFPQQPTSERRSPTVPVVRLACLAAAMLVASSPVCQGELYAMVDSCMRLDAR